MAANDFTPPAQQINDDIALSLSNPFYGGGGQFDPKVFITAPKDKTTAAITSVKNEQQLLDAVMIMSKARTRDKELANFDPALKKAISKNKLHGETFAENLVIEHDVRSPSQGGFARNQAERAMTLSFPYQMKQNRDKPKDLNEL